jgi:hypothetical protein
MYHAFLRIGTHQSKQEKHCRRYFFHLIKINQLKSRAPKGPANPKVNPNYRTSMKSYLIYIVYYLRYKRQCIQVLCHSAVCVGQVFQTIGISKLICSKGKT